MCLQTARKRQIVSLVVHSIRGLKPATIRYNYCRWKEYEGTRGSHVGSVTEYEEKEGGLME